MHTWIWSAFTGVNLGVIVFVMTLVPVLLWQVRKYGGVSAGRLLGTAAVSVYMSALVVYTQLPVPEGLNPTWCRVNGGQNPQLVPFESFRMVGVRAEEIGWGATLTSTLGLQLIFNVLLFIPWGVIVRRFFERSFITTVVSGLLMSVLIEATQATGVWGTFACAYRLGDIDDVFTNTLGAFIGALIAPAVLYWMPKTQTLARQRLHPRPVTRRRKLLGMVLNLLLVYSVSFGLAVLLRVLWRALAGKVDLDAFAWVTLVMHCGVVAVVLLIPAWQGRGSLGQYAVWLRPQWRNSHGQPSSGSRVLRLSRSAVLALPFVATFWPGQTFMTTVFVFLACVSAVMVLVTPTQRSLSEWLTGAVAVDTRVRAGS